jgi:DNA repair protein RadC
MYEKVAVGNFSEHEWLEILLYPVLPRRDTNVIAHRLMLRFGTTDDVFHASMEELQSVEGVGIAVASHIKCIGHFIDHKPAPRPIFSDAFTSHGFLPYVKKVYKTIPYEVMDIYLLDGYSHVIARQGFSAENLYEAQVVPEEIASFLLTKDASGVVLVHNHPKGEAKYSTKDDVMTKNLQMLCSMHNRLLCDHIIYATDGVYSYYMSGRLAAISQHFSIDKMLKDTTMPTDIPG